MKCWICSKGTLVSKRKPLSYEGVRLGTFAVEACPECGHEFVGMTSARLIDQAFDRAFEEGRLTPPRRWKARHATAKGRSPGAVARARKSVLNARSARANARRSLGPAKPRRP